MASTTDTRKRNFCFVVARESAPADWQAILAAEHVPAFISPLHCDDVNADGTKKFDHWHVLLMFRGKKTLDQAKELAHKVGAVNDYVQVVQDARGYARYLIHADNPEKAQYKAGDVVSLGGADYLSVIGTAADTDSALGEMMDWCIEQGCYSFFRLSVYARANRPDWFRVITSSRTVFLTAWLKSMQWEISQGADLLEIADGAQEDAVAQDGDLTNDSTTNNTKNNTTNNTNNTNNTTIECPDCGSHDVRKHGKTASDLQRYQCKDCGKTFLG